MTRNAYCAEHEITYPEGGSCFYCAQERQVVGHKTFADGRHEPLTRAEADAIWAACKAAEAKRAADMPDVQSAINTMMDAFQRLKALGWREAVYCPKDGTEFEVIEPGSTGIHRCIYEGEWPTGRWWILHDGDMSPSRPTLFRPLATGEGASNG